MREDISSTRQKHHGDIFMDQMAYYAIQGRRKKTDVFQIASVYFGASRPPWDG